MAALYTSPSSPTAGVELANSELTVKPKAPMCSTERFLEGITTINQYKGIRELKKCIDKRAAELLAGSSSEQYIAFRVVSKEDLDKIDKERASIGKDIRLYHQFNGLMIIKLMLSPLHEIAHIMFGDGLKDAIAAMGLARNSLVPIGAGRFSGMLSSKEGDTSFKPRSLRPQQNGWPTIVIEAGLSESRNRLRTDAAWWLTNSHGEVNIIILIVIMKSTQFLRLEKWCAVGGPVTRANPNRKMVNELEITPIPGTPGYAVTGAPLVLEFEKIFLSTCGSRS
jgi:hypothetical protein